VAKKFGVNWKEIKRVNRLRSNLIRVGQKLKIPKKRSVRKARRSYYTRRDVVYIKYRVRRGDSLQKIGKKFGVNWKEIKRVNRLRSNLIIDIYAPCGDRIRAVDRGRVIYSGDDLAPYGNMVIIEHPGYLSIYAFNMQNLVERGERVAKGEGG